MNLEKDILGMRNQSHRTTVYTKQGPKNVVRRSRLQTLAGFIANFLEGRKAGDKSKCWNWLRSTNNLGYGQLMCSGKNLKAHKIAYLIHYGEIPDGACVLHRCDNPKCVNPHHLFLGTQKENVQDMVSKDHHIKGSDHKLAKLTDVEALEILKSSETHAALARRYKVTSALIGMIRRGKKWKHCHAEALSVKSPLEAIG